MISDSILGAIGNTPIVRLNNISRNIYVKLESANPGGSIKDRAALFMIRDAESKGILKKNGMIVEPTSGNTGIGLAMVSAALGYRLTIVMPDSMSRERADIMKAYGAEVVFSQGKEGMDGAVKIAESIASENGAFIPQQFSNANNVMSHFLGTAKEILEDVPDVDFIVAGIGTGGTATGIGMGMRKFAPNVKVIGVEPSESPLISEGHAGPHGIQGIGANFIPSILNTEYIDRIMTVNVNDASEMTRRLAREEGILVGISSGAAVAVSLQIVKEHPKSKVVTILPDSGERYMSTGLFSEVRP